VKARRLPVAVLAALLALAAVIALPPGGSAAPAPTAACAAVLAPRPAIELPVQVAPGLTVRVRDPYGGLIARNRLFVAFSVRYRARADRARVATVTWTLDGATPRRDEGGRDQFLAPSTMYSVGRHVVGVRIQPVGGGPAGGSRPSSRSRRPTASWLPCRSDRPSRAAAWRSRSPRAAPDCARSSYGPAAGASGCRTAGAWARSGCPEGAAERCAPRR
jgi:hypothetical protein